MYNTYEIRVKPINYMNGSFGWFLINVPRKTFSGRKDFIEIACVFFARQLNYGIEYK